MKLWLISQDVNDGYDTYDSAVVVADDAETARTLSPSGYYVWKDGGWHFKYSDGTTSAERQRSDWTDPENVKVELIGEAEEKWKSGDVVCASFNAG